ncbi:hypothetical protein [Ruegeria atlantica]|uniref:hypothetical protein n=1 Tax=Ruegeria atlantica TaxID=81569 RepID=UPI00147C7081|nr:hypothetical protein [Ruegeria atlantica]
MKSSAEDNINRLLRGISTDHVETVRDAWRALMADQEKSVPQVQRKLASCAWTSNPPGPLPKYLGVLLALLSEIDLEVFRQEITRLGKGKLHPVHRRTLDLMAKRLEDTPSTFLTETIPVFIADDVADPLRVTRNLQRWSKTKGLSLKDVTRIDVIVERPELDYLGSYNLFFSGIILTAPTTRPKGLDLWLQTSEGEFTFYHEVGHHFHKHIEGGQIEEQEQEADDCARTMMRSSQPVLTFVGRCLGWLLRPLLNQPLKRLESKVQQNRIKTN